MVRSCSHSPGFDSDHGDAQDAKDTVRYSDLFGESTSVRAFGRRTDCLIDDNVHYMVLRLL